MTDSYVIDGYNLIHALGLLDRSLGPRVLETARRRLLDFLYTSFGDASSRVTIIFDARKAPPRVSREQRYHGLQIRFAPGSQSADDLIEAILEEHAKPRSLIIVSNDTRLQQAAHRCGARSWSHTALLDYIEKQAILAAKPKGASSPDEKQAQPMSRDELDHWLTEFQALETDPELKEFFDMDRFED